MRIVVSQVIGDARYSGVHITPTKRFDINDLACRGLHQWRTAKKYRPLALDNNRFIGHGWHIGAARGTRAHDNGELWNLFC